MDIGQLLDNTNLNYALDCAIKIGKEAGIYGMLTAGKALPFAYPGAVIVNTLRGQRWSSLYNRDTGWMTLAGVAGGMLEDIAKDVCNGCQGGN